MDETQPLEHPPNVGERVFDSDGRFVGRVSGLTDEGFEIEFPDASESEIEEIPGQEFGEGYLMWRCGQCGEMAELTGGLPEVCSACKAPREALLVVEED